MILHQNLDQILVLGNLKDKLKSNKLKPLIIHQPYFLLTDDQELKLKGKLPSIHLRH